MTQRRCARSSTARGFVSRCSSFPTREHGGSEGLTPMHVDGVASLNTSSLAITRVEWGRMCSGRCARTEISGGFVSSNSRSTTQSTRRSPPRSSSGSAVACSSAAPMSRPSFLGIAFGELQRATGCVYVGRGGYAIDYCDYFYT